MTKKKPKIKWKWTSIGVVIWRNNFKWRPRVSTHEKLGIEVSWLYSTFSIYFHFDY